MDTDDINTIQELIDEDPPNLEPSNHSSWAVANFKIIAILLAIGLSPVCTYFGSGRVEKIRTKFEREDRAKKRETQLRIHRQKMRTTLVKEVVSIAKNADLDNVAHAYRIGLIAEIVMSNPDVFKLNMRDAKDKLDVIIKKMKVVHNIRKQLAETEKSEAELQGKVKRYDKENVNLEKKLKRMKKKYDAVKWRSYKDRMKWQKKVEKVEKALKDSRFRRRMYAERLQRERRRRRLYAHYLRYTQRRLQKKVNAAQTAKKKSDLEVKKLNGVLATLELKTSTASKEIKQLKGLVRKLTKAKQDSEATAQDLSDEVKKLKAANKVLRSDNKTLMQKVAECKPKKAMTP